MPFSTAKHLLQIPLSPMLALFHASPNLLLYLSFRPKPVRPPTHVGGVLEPLEALVRGPAAALAAAATPVRKTKLVCTIGPASCNKEMFFKLADAGEDSLMGDTCMPFCICLILVTAQLWAMQRPWHDSNKFVSMFVAVCFFGCLLK